MATEGRLQRDPRREVLLQLGNKIESARYRSGLTRKSLAESLGISISYVSLIERGGRNPPYTTIVAIANALGVSLREMFE
jgi:transcriptional regulator with XRE-family HTH domain